MDLLIFYLVIKIVQEMFVTPNPGHPVNEKAVCNLINLLFFLDSFYIFFVSLLYILWFDFGFI